ncbi:class I SAM-dependent methyltransferase [Thermoflexus sp.]|uniref:class I SAM-dependent methyltransferase n=1 Tax=Thermoflexus sp. TaxID=1969742 RepID=UPI0035E41E38
MELRYTAIAEAFDRIAPIYDEHYSAQANPIQAWMRAEAMQVLREVLPPGGWVLEIGCGTGEETLALAHAGFRVLATDIAPEMLHCAQSKISRAGLAHRVTFVAIPAGYLAALRPPQPFDGAYAGFGALNCEPALERFVQALAGLLPAGAPLVLSVINSRCLVEALWHLIHGRLQAAFRGRGNNWAIATLPGPDGERIPLPMRPLSAGVLRKAFAPSFQIERTMALPLLLPPPPMADLLQRHPPLLRPLVTLDRMARARWPWRDWGDHLLMIMRRR